MTNPIAKFVGDINTRLKRLEEDIGSTTDSVLRFMSIKEGIEINDTIYIYKRDMNDSFLVGTSRVGVDRLGDRRSAEVLLWSGG